MEHSTNMAGNMFESVNTIHQLMDECADLLAHVKYLLTSLLLTRVLIKMILIQIQIIGKATEFAFLSIIGSTFPTSTD